MRGIKFIIAGTYKYINKSTKDHRNKSEWNKNLAIWAYQITQRQTKVRKYQVEVKQNDMQRNRVKPAD
jgi:hypothetical protein